MRKIYSADAPEGEIVCHSPDGLLYRFVEPDYWQLVTPAPTPAPGSEAAFGEFKQAGELAIKKGGITVRDYFAAKALQGMLAYPGDEQRGSHHNNNDAEGVAQMSYAYADAMLAARGESK